MKISRRSQRTGLKALEVVSTYCWTKIAMAHGIGHDWGRELPLVDCGLQLQELGHVVEVLPLLCLKMFQNFLGWVMVLRWAIEGRNMVEDWNIRQRCW